MAGVVWTGFAGTVNCFYGISFVGGGKIGTSGDFPLRWFVGTGFAGTGTGFVGIAGASVQVCWFSEGLLAAGGQNVCQASVLQTPVNSS